jgi:hypothetical protein
MEYAKDCTELSADRLLVCVLTAYDKNNAPPSVTVFGPPGCGKSHHAQQIAERFGLRLIVDGSATEVAELAIANKGVLYLSRMPIHGTINIPFGPCLLGTAASGPEPTSTGILRARQGMPAIDELDRALLDAGNEVLNARANWPPFNSAHEAFAVMSEEVTELWQHVCTKQSRRDLPAMRKEAIQVAAMALRFAIEVCTEERGRK